MRIYRIDQQTAERVAVKIADIHKSDYDYLVANGIPFSRAVRLGIKEYVLMEKAKAENRNPVLDLPKAELHHWIMSAPDTFKPVPVPVYTYIEVEKPHEPVPYMGDWTKAERDEWIWTGRVPTRA